MTIAGWMLIIVLLGPNGEREDYKDRYMNRDFGGVWQALKACKKGGKKQFHRIVYLDKGFYCWPIWKVTGQG